MFPIRSRWPHPEFSPGQPPKRAKPSLIDLPSPSRPFLPSPSSPSFRTLQPTSEKCAWKQCTELHIAQNHFRYLHLKARNKVSNAEKGNGGHSASWQMHSQLFWQDPGRGKAPWRGFKHLPVQLQQSSTLHVLVENFSTPQVPALPPALVTQDPSDTCNYPPLFNRHQLPVVSQLMHTVSISSGSNNSRV